MGGSGVGDQADIRAHQADGVSDVTHSRGAELDDRAAVFGAQFQQRQWRTEVVVQIAARSQHGVVPVSTAQNAGEHFLDAGLATRAGDGGDWPLEGLTVERPQTPQRQASIGDNQLRQRRALDFACDQSRHRAFGGHLGEIGMTIEARTGQRNEQLPRLGRPAVSADRREAGIGPHQTAGQRQLQLAQSHGFKHRASPRWTVRYRLPRYRRTAAARRECPDSPRGPCQRALPHRWHWRPR